MFHTFYTKQDISMTLQGAVERVDGNLERSEGMDV